MGSPKIKLGKHRGAGGRPSKFTEETRRTIVSAIRAGNYRDSAALYAGIDERTFYRWMARGEAEEPGYCQFCQDIKKAEGFAQVSSLGIIARAAVGSPIEYMVNSAGELVCGKDGKPVVLKHEKDPVWTAAAWQLERKHPEKYGRRLESTIRGIGDRGEILVRHKHLVDLSRVSDRDLHTLRRIAVRSQAIESEEGETVH